MASTGDRLTKIEGSLKLLINKSQMPAKPTPKVVEELEVTKSHVALLSDKLNTKSGQLDEKERKVTKLTEEKAGLDRKITSLENAQKQLQDQLGSVRANVQANVAEQNIKLTTEHESIVRALQMKISRHATMLEDATKENEAMALTHKSKVDTLQREHCHALKKIRKEMKDMYRQEKAARPIPESEGNHPVPHREKTPEAHPVDQTDDLGSHRDETIAEIQPVDQNNSQPMINEEGSVRSSDVQEPVVARDWHVTGNPHNTWIEVE